MTKRCELEIWGLLREIEWLRGTPFAIDSTTKAKVTVGRLGNAGHWCGGIMYGRTVVRMNLREFSKSAYRPEIDGLRALAVIAVIINHFNDDILPSGYLGVDIFFVISGFVITSSLTDRRANDLGDFFLGFYVRRSKRLIPALVLFVIVTSFIVCVFNPNPVGTLKTGMASLFGVSNIYLFKQSTDYFAASTELNVFTHTWSLGVEEQFYLVFPFLLWFGGFGRVHNTNDSGIILLIGSLCVTSFIGFLFLYRCNQPAAYFLMPTRFWELAAGCLLFLDLQRPKPLMRYLHGLPSLLIVVIVLCILLLPLKFAAPATAAVVVLTVALIACVRPGTAAFHMFACKQSVFIGRISYSLYLWHWGVLSLCRWTIGIHWWTVPLQVTLMLATSIASYHYVETPLRRSEWSAIRGRSIIYGIVCSATASGLIFLLALPTIQRRIYAGVVNSMEEQYLINRTNNVDVNIDGCNVYEDGIKATSISELCGLRVASSRPTIFLLGDSHIHQFRNEIALIARERRYNVRLVWGNSCLFPAAIIREEGAYPYSGAKCFELQSLVARSLIDQVKSGDIIIIGNSLYANFSPDWPGWKNTLKYSLPTGQPLSISAAADKYSLSVKTLTDRLVGRGATVVMYLDSAQFAKLERDEACQPQWFHPISESCQMNKIAYLERRDELFGWVNTWSDGKHRIVWDGLDESTCGPRVLS